MIKNFGDLPDKTRFIKDNKQFVKITDKDSKDYKANCNAREYNTGECWEFANDDTVFSLEQLVAA